MKADAVMTDVVDRLVAKLEAGAGEWSVPWSGVFPTAPRNATTGVGYRGANVLILWITQLDHLHPTADWATYKQWAAAGRQVRKGERGTRLIKWSMVSKVDDAGQVREWMVPYAFVVFNVAQTDGDDDGLLPIEMPPPGAFAEMIAHVPFKQVVGKPCYVPALDVVSMPPLAAFDTSDDWASTLAHELAHWTGHESRLARTFGKRFGDETYAAEELVAELSSAFTCARFGVVPGARSDHASYLGHWVSLLRADPSILWSVASKAQAATDHLLNYVPSTEVSHELAHA